VFFSDQRERVVDKKNKSKFKHTQEHEEKKNMLPAASFPAFAGTSLKSWANGLGA